MMERITAMTESEWFFERYGPQRMEDVCKITFEELYQHFKDRLMKELRAECAVHTDRFGIRDCEYYELVEIAKKEQ
jgi:hypothetical protein